MIIAYRLKGTSGYMPGESRGHTIGVITRVHDKLKKPPRPPHYPSESDWMVPNLRDPYALHQTERA